MNIRRLFVLWFVFAVSIAGAQVPPECDGTDLSWTTPTLNKDGSALPTSAITGYRIYFGTNAANLTSTIDIPGAGTLQKRVTGLGCGTWYFATTTRTATDESARTLLVSKTLIAQAPVVPPVIPTIPAQTGTLVLCCHADWGDSGGCTEKDQPSGCNDARWEVATGACKASVGNWTALSALPATALVKVSTTAMPGAAKCSEVTGTAAAGALLAEPIPPIVPPVPPVVPTPVPVPLPPTAELCLVDSVGSGIRPIYSVSATGTRGAKVGDLKVPIAPQPAGTSSPARNPECSCTDLKTWSGVVYSKVQGGYVAGCKTYGFR